MINLQKESETRKHTEGKSEAHFHIRSKHQFPGVFSSSFPFRLELPALYSEKEVKKYLGFYFFMKEISV